LLKEELSRRDPVESEELGVVSRKRANEVTDEDVVHLGAQLRKKKRIEPDHSMSHTQKQTPAREADGEALTQSFRRHTPMVVIPSRRP
jgi:hypothetical protein